MPSVVCFEYSGEIKVVKTAWCEKLKSADPKNSGVLPTKIIKIFYSNNTAQKANFGLEVVEEFDENVPACYYGYVLYMCGKKIDHSIHNLCHFF